MKLFSLLPRRLSHFACNSPGGRRPGVAETIKFGFARILYCFVETLAARMRPEDGVRPQRPRAVPETEGERS